jgi:hypothetical protein
MCITLDINCGKDICASKPGSFCRFVVTRIDGSTPRCTLFDKSLFDTKGGMMGWLQRCDECKEAGK